MADWDNDITGQRPLSTTSQHVVLHGINDTQRLFEKSENILHDEHSGAAIIVEQRVNHILSCGHVAEQVHQIIECQCCKARICQVCQCRCSRCLKVLCNADAKWLWDKLYCSPCRVVVGLRESVVALFSAVAWAILSALKVIPVLLRGLHRLLSKEL